MAEFADGRPSGSGFTRRQFSLMLAGGAAAAALGGNFVAARTALELPGRDGPARTSFGTVRIERAKRMARFAPGTFSTAGHRVTAGHHHDGPASPRPSDPSRLPFNETWADVVVLWLAVENTSPAPVFVSPGQLRLRVPSGPSVTPRNSSASGLDLPPRGTAGAWVSYLAPVDAGPGFGAEFTDPMLDRAVALTIPTPIPLAEARNDAEPWAA
jgi:hypothetical protein